MEATPKLSREAYIQAMRQRVEELQCEADMATYDEHHARAETLARAGELPEAFREYCRAMRPLSAARKHDLSRCLEQALLPALHDAHPHGAAAFEFDLLHQRVGEHREVGPTERGMEEGARIAQPHAVALVEFVDAVAVLLRPVEILAAAMPDLDG